MRKIFTSLLIVASVTSLAVVATQAFFSDTETSTGNSVVAGSLDLQVAHSGTYNLTPIPSWGPKNIEVSDKFFALTDVKPGDQGQNNVNVSAENDFWACVTVNNLINNGNGVTESEGETEEDDGVGEGELAQSVNFAIWADDGDNIHEAGEPTTTGTASAVLSGNTYAIRDASNSFGNPILSGATGANMGFYWCVGSLTMDDTGAFICNGNDVGNTIQTDSMTADIEFYATQARNNADFTCDSLNQAEAL